MFTGVPKVAIFAAKHVYTFRWGSLTVPCGAASAAFYAVRIVHGARLKTSARPCGGGYRARDAASSSAFRAPRLLSISSANGGLDRYRRATSFVSNHAKNDVLARFIFRQGSDMSGGGSGARQAFFLSYGGV